MKVILAGGGTGGHLYPGIAIAERLKELNINVLFLVSDRGIEKEILTPLGYEFVEQKVTAFKGKGLADKLGTLKALFRETLNALKLIRKEDKVILLGGFASASAGAASIFRKNELFIHEQNSVMGLTNRLFADTAKRVFLSFDNTFKSQGQTMVVGNPVREEFQDCIAKEKLTQNILIVGGSQGSRAVNQMVVSVAAELIEKGFQIKHQTGKKLYDEVTDAYGTARLTDAAALDVADYITDMKAAYEWADVIISRAGSGSVFEIMYSKRPAIFIPLSIAADNHQMFNALMAEKAVGAKMMDEKTMTGEKLVSAITHIYEQYTDDLLPLLGEIKFQDTVDIIIGEMNID